MYGGLICAKFVFDAVMQSLRLLVCMRFIGRYLVWEKGRQGRSLHILINYWLQRKYLFKITRPVRATLRMLYWPMCNAVQLCYVCAVITNTQKCTYTVLCAIVSNMLLYEHDLKPPQSTHSVLINVCRQNLHDITFLFYLCL